MIDQDMRLADELDRLVPLPDADDACWLDALARAQRQRRWWLSRELKLAAALVAALFLMLALTPLGGALGRGIGDFSAWLGGAPGEPASKSDQEAFERANRQWQSFPKGTQLRRLISAQAGGGTFELFGFRSGDSLCLRLAVSGIPISRKSGPLPTSCAPLDELRASDAPLVVVGTDYGVGLQDVEPTSEGHVPPLASATFGIVADGVDHVELVSNHGSTEAIVEHDAFLSVVDRPPLDLRNREAIATTSDSRRLRIPIAESPFDAFWPAARAGVAPGPKEVKRKPEGRTIGWLTRREPRGESLEEARLKGRFGDRNTVFARVVKPDPRGYLRVVVELHESGVICDYLVEINGAGGGCFAPRAAFERNPFILGISVENGGDQYAVLEGLATDDVAYMKLYLATGERRTVPLKDNAYVVAVPRTKYPARLVAYDADDRVIGIEEMSHDPLTTTGPRPVGPFRVVLIAEGARGTRGELRVARSTDGGRCFRVIFSGGAGGSGCPPKETKSPPLALAVEAAGRDSFVTGEVAANVARVQLEFASGRSADLHPVEGFVLFAIPSGDEVAVASGFDDEGRVVGRWRLHPPAATH